MLDLLGDNHEYIMEMFLYQKYKNKEDFVNRYNIIREALILHLKNANKKLKEKKSGSTYQSQRNNKISKDDDEDEDEDENNMRRKKRILGLEKYEENKEIEMQNFYLSGGSSIGKERTYFENPNFHHSKSQDPDNLMKYTQKPNRFSNEESVNLVKEEDKDMEMLNDSNYKEDEMNVTGQLFLNSKVIPYKGISNSRQANSRQKCYSPNYADEEEEVKQEKEIARLNQDLYSGKSLRKRNKNKNK